MYNWPYTKRVIHIQSIKLFVLLVFHAKILDLWMLLRYVLKIAEKTISILELSHNNVICVAKNSRELLIAYASYESRTSFRPFSRGMQRTIVNAALPIGI